MSSRFQNHIESSTHQFWVFPYKLCVSLDPSFSHAVLMIFAFSSWLRFFWHVYHRPTHSRRYCYCPKFSSFPSGILIEFCPKLLKSNVKQNQAKTEISVLEIERETDGEWDESRTMRKIWLLKKTIPFFKSISSISEFSIHWSFFRNFLQILRRW